MRHRVRLTESDLHRIVRGAVKRVLSENLWNISDFSNNELSVLDGTYIVYSEGEALNVYIDVENEEISIGGWSEEGKEALDAIREIYAFYRYSNNGIESAIEQFVYDQMR